MDRETHQADEKISLLSEEVERIEPTKLSGRRTRSKELALSILIFVWWSYYFIPSILGREKKGHTVPVDGPNELDFDTVRQPQCHRKDRAANLIRLFRVRS